MLKLNADINGLKEIQETIAHIPGAIGKARDYSLSKALAAMKAVAVEQTQQDYYVKGSAIRKSITLRKYKDGTAQFISRGRRLLLSDYYLNPGKIQRKRKPLYGAVRRDTGIKPLGSAFLIRGQNSGKILPMVRTTRARYPIKALIAPAIPQIIGNDGTIKAMNEAGSEAFRKEFQRQALRALGVLK